MNKICESCLFNNSGAFCCAAQKVRWNFNEFVRTFFNETPIVREFRKGVELDDECYEYIEREE